MKSDTTVRLSTGAYEIVSKLSEQTGKSFKEIASLAIENMDKKIVIKEVPATKLEISIE